MPQIGFNCKEVLSTKLIYVHYGLKPPFFLENSRRQQILNLATAQTSLGFCWAAVEGAKIGITRRPPRPVTQPHCRTQAGYHSSALLVCSIFLAKQRQEWPLARDVLYFLSDFL